MDKIQLKKMMELSKLSLSDSEQTEFSKHFDALLASLEVIKCANHQSSKNNELTIAESEFRNDEKNFVKPHFEEGAHFSSGYFQVPKVIKDKQ